MIKRNKHSEEIIDFFLSGTEDVYDIAQRVWPRVQNLALDLEKYCQKTDKILPASTKYFITLAQCHYYNVSARSRFIAASRVLNTAYNLRIKGVKNYTELFERIQGK